MACRPGATRVRVLEDPQYPDYEQLYAPLLHPDYEQLLTLFSRLLLSRALCFRERATFCEGGNTRVNASEKVVGVGRQGEVPWSGWGLLVYPRVYLPWVHPSSSPCPHPRLRAAPRVRRVRGVYNGVLGQGCTPWGGASTRVCTPWGGPVPGCVPMVYREGSTDPMVYREGSTDPMGYGRYHTPYLSQAVRP